MSKKIVPEPGKESEVARELVESGTAYTVDTSGPRLAYVVADDGGDKPRQGRAARRKGAAKTDN